MSLPLSVCMIVRDEADQILASLSSVADVARQVVVVRVHEQLTLDGQPVAAIPTGVALLHNGYSPSIVATRNKVERNLHLLNLELTESPRDAYLHYQSGRTLYVGQRFDEAAESLR